ncbi:hypothetical protein H2199_001273 [Coniosporium tulheliwenetii]|uniref:Uncharacterized protein n=1 Tax=Coniosporium tulheliwenetii TaxID=3383036 RepID=A0ACC2ZLE0_9PEZI|nr:hypothetical protein H2199_001273 [Cladosporium sp. JES 115]
MSSTLPTSAHQGAGQGQNGSNTSNQTQTDTAPSDQSPADEKISDFDWDDLLNRYHKVMEERNIEEEKVYAEFASLINLYQYFTLWAHTTSIHEVDRSYKR